MPSVNVLIVEKTGEIRSLKIKDYVESELYKKAGFKSAEGFKLQTSWAVNVEGVEHKVLLFAKATGKAGGENKYDFPPPVDATLFFGACVLVGVRAGQPADLTPDQWSKFYEFLFGGFEDVAENLGDEDDMETDDEIEQMERELEKELGKPVKIQTTKHGYVKDDFIVDDDEIEDDEIEDEEDEMSDDSYVEPKKKSSAKQAKSAKAKVQGQEKQKQKVENTKTNEKKERKKREPKVKESKSNSNSKMEELVAEEKNPEYLDCSSELTYEEYHK